MGVCYVHVLSPRRNQYLNFRADFPLKKETYRAQRFSTPQLGPNPPPTPTYYTSPLRIKQSNRPSLLIPEQPGHHAIIARRNVPPGRECLDVSFVWFWDGTCFI